MNPVVKFLILTTAAATLSACGVHRITIQQGNIVSQEMIDKLKPGMTRSQVAFVMGEPVLRSTFNDDRWEYIYTIVVPGRYESEQRVTLFFHDDVLAYFTGDLAPTAAKDETEVAESNPDSDPG